MFGCYEGGWDAAAYLNPTDAAMKFPTSTYKSKSGKDYMDFKAWAEGLKAEDRDKH